MYKTTREIDIAILDYELNAIQDHIVAFKRLYEKNLLKDNPDFVSILDKYLIEINETRNDLLKGE
jgi:hypothetical protein